jgi:hypothetical protein
MSGVTPGRRTAAAVAVVVLALLPLALRPAPARADVVDVILHVPGEPLGPACNGEEVIVHGDLHIRVVTTPTPNGGSIVHSLTTSEGLEGTGTVTNLPYTAMDVEFSAAHYAPPGGTSAFADVHATLLVPQGDAPTSLLVMVVKETVAPDGTTTPTLERTFVVCRPPGQGAVRAA